MSEEQKDLDAAIRKLADDNEFVKKVWKRGFDEWSAHLLTSVAQWVGRHLLTVIFFSLLTAAIVWTVKMGFLS